MQDKKTKKYVRNMLYLSMTKNAFDVIDTYEVEVLNKIFNDFWGLVKNEINIKNYSDQIELEKISVLNDILKSMPK